MKLLIFAPYGIGNLILLHPTLKALKNNNIKFDIVSFLGSVDNMLENWNEFSSLYDHKWSLTGSKKEVIREIFKIRKKKYDLSILSFPSAKPHYNLLSFLCGAKRRIGSRYNDDSVKTLSFLNTDPIPVKYGLHDVFQNLDLFQNGNIAITANMLKLPPINKNAQNIIGFHLGCSAGGSYKRWPLKKWETLIELLKKQQPQFTLRLFFGPDEQEELNYFQNNPHTEIITGLSLSALKEKISESALFISNDSGLMHIAAFTGVPGIAIAGPSDETRTGPFSTQKRVITGECDIRPCSHSYTLKSHKFSCPYESRRCLESIPVENVLKAVGELLKERLKY